MIEISHLALLILCIFLISAGGIIWEYLRDQINWDKFFKGK